VPLPVQSSPTSSAVRCEAPRLDHDRLPGGRCWAPGLVRARMNAALAFVLVVFIVTGVYWWAETVFIVARGARRWALGRRAGVS